MIFSYKVLGTRNRRSVFELVLLVDLPSGIKSLLFGIELVVRFFFGTTGVNEGFDSIVVLHGIDRTKSSDSCVDFGGVFCREGLVI
jgi:hypothetical protein